MSNPPHILVVDDEPDIRHLLQEILQDEGYSVAIAKDAATARQARQQQRPDLILLDIWMPDVDGITLLKEWNKQEPLTQPVIIMSGHGTVETAVEATRLGAFDYIEKPLSLTKLLLIVRHALEHYSMPRDAGASRQRKHQAGEAIEPVGRSQRMQKLRQQARQMAQYDMPLLLSGEAGSGRQCFAAYIHQHSSRREAPFVEHTLANTTEEQALALFGDERQEGVLAKARGGTLYLKDVARLTIDNQGRMLEWLRSGGYRRNGEENRQRADVRLFAATSQPLDQLVAQGRFNHDLYYQLNVLMLVVPPLRDHNEDVLDLVSYYSNYYVETDNLPWHGYSTAALNRLRQYEWPGNVLELKNLVQHLLITTHDSQIELEEVEAALARQGHATISHADIYELSLRQAREQFEHDYFEQLLRRYQGSVNSVAQHAEVERTHLYRKLRSLGLDAKDFS